MLQAAAIAIGGTSVVLAGVSRLQTGSPFAGFNAVSQLVWGPAAAEHDDLSLRHTVVGAAAMASALAGWSVVATLLAGRTPSGARAVVAGLAAGAIAYTIDYHVVPPRLAPGIELRLSRAGVYATFGALTASLVAGQLLRAR